jgi:hypothetical protein
VNEPRLIDVRKLAGVAELARLFMVGRTTVTQWAARADRNGFPDPVARLAMGPVFDLDEVLDWYTHYEPDKGGRPGRMPGAGEIAHFGESTVHSG